MDKKSLGERYEFLTKAVSECFKEITENSRKFQHAKKKGNISRQISITRELHEIHARRRRLIKEKREIEKALNAVS